jgi:DUF4097 and DUF4098 domain-containing protein YvlB
MFYEKIAVAVSALALAATLVNARDRRVMAREPFQHTFSNDKTLDVDNISGSIQVIGDDQRTIRVEGERITHAEDQQAVDHAKRDVTLDVNEKDGIAQLYVNGPFRHDHSEENHGFHVHWDDHDYEVEYDFTIHVPRDTELRLHSVNGQITAQDTRGKFGVSGVNGSVTMNNIAGYGDLRTVNGKVTVSFRESPKQACDFKTVNGAIDASFPPNLAADLRFKTMNGGAFTDFETTLVLPKTADAVEQSNGKFVYRPDRAQNVRIGAGGPELSFETLNGTIRIKKETR